MPNLNGTGPQGQGPMTGGRRGRCRVVPEDTVRNAGTTPADTQGTQAGLGRGGRPFGGGMGKGAGGAKRKGLGRWFGMPGGRWL